jgi:hypothetical protein
VKNNTLEFIRAVRDTADHFRSSEIDEIELGRLNKGHDYYKKLYGTLKGTAVYQNDSMRHRMFSIVFARNIGTFTKLTNCEAQAFFQITQSYQLRHSDFPNVVEDIISETP